MRKSVLALAVSGVLVGLGFSGAPAIAQQNTPQAIELQRRVQQPEGDRRQGPAHGDYWRDDGWRNQGWRDDRGYRHWHRPRYRPPPVYYYPPPAYYYSPPVYYDPPPVYYPSPPPPGFRFWFNN